MKHTHYLKDDFTKRASTSIRHRRLLWLLVGFGLVWLSVWGLLHSRNFNRPSSGSGTDFSISSRRHNNDERNQRNSEDTSNNERLLLKASPLPGQISSAQFFSELSDFESSFWCGGDSGGKDVLGFQLGGKHGCVMRNMCIVRDTPTLFIPSDAGEKTTKVFRGLPSVVFRDIGNVVIDSSRSAASMLRESRASGKYHRGLSAIIGSSYGQSHITHFMEPLGELFQFLSEFGYYSDHVGDGGYMKEPLSSKDSISLSSVQQSDEFVTRFNRSAFALEYAQLLRVLVVGSAPHTPSSGSFVENFYRMLATNRISNDGGTQLPLLIDSQTKFAGECFEEVLMVGASYNPLQFVHAPSFIRHRDWYQQQTGIIGHSDEQRASALEAINRPVMQPSEAAAEAIAAAVKDISSPRPIRNVLIAHRSSKRRVGNEAAFNQWLTEVLPQLLPQWDWRIRPVHFGGLTNTQQAQLAHWADILIGIHGADLTNLINMRPWSVVIELNMFFFFEPRFNAMSRSLQLHYLTWTCTRPSCSSVFKRVANLPHSKDWHYNLSTEEVLINPLHAAKYKGGEAIQYEYHMELHKETNGRFRWPFYGAYDVEGCVACNLLTCCTSMHNTLYGVQRESDIKFTETEFSEMQYVMKMAATKAQSKYVATPHESISAKLARLRSNNLKS